MKEPSQTGMRGKVDVIEDISLGNHDALRVNGLNRDVQTANGADERQVDACYIAILCNFLSFEMFQLKINDNQRRSFLKMCDLGQAM